MAGETLRAAVLGFDGGNIDVVLLGTMVGETGGAAVLGINEGNIDGELNIDGMLYDGGRDAWSSSAWN